MKEIQNEVFKNLRVLELATVLAGPLVGRFFAEGGARVIKVEPPSGDVTRQWKSKSKKDELSSYFASANAQKNYLSIDLKSAEGLQQLNQLLEESDVFISNLLPESARKLGFAPEQLRKKFPGLVSGIIEGYGNNSNRPAYDIVLQAEAGYLSMTGKGQTPARLPVAFIDVLAAHQLKEGILMGLLNKSHNGQGCVVRVSLLDVAIGSLANQAGSYLMDDTIPERMGTLHPHIAPYGECFTCSDGKFMVLAVGNDVQFDALCKLFDLQHLLTDLRFSSNSFRIKNRDALFTCLSEVFLEQSSEHWNTEMQKAGIPAGILKNLKEVFESHEAKALIHEETIAGECARSVKTMNIKMLR
jgi:crotonobetainyl-CoA:carnitine CoA-transferase CaiB-like acyl-CoA transferase